MFCVCVGEGGCAGPYRFSSASVASSSSGGPSFATDGDTDVADALGTIASVQSSLAAKKLAV